MRQDQHGRGCGDRAEAGAGLQRQPRHWGRGLQAGGDAEAQQIPEGYLWLIEYVNIVYKICDM